MSNNQYIERQDSQLSHITSPIDAAITKLEESPTTENLVYFIGELHILHSDTGLSVSSIGSYSDRVSLAVTSILRKAQGPAEQINLKARISNLVTSKHLNLTNTNTLRHALRRLIADAIDDAIRNTPEINNTVDQTH